MNNITFNENINESNFLIYKQKSKIIINEIIPFIKDFMKIAYHLSKEKITNDEYDIPTFDGDNKIFSAFSRSILNSFKYQYSLNSDIYNFKNEFFDESKIKSVKINKAPRYVVLKNIIINRRNNLFYITYYFSVKIIVNKQLSEEDVIFQINFAEISKDNGFKLKNNYQKFIEENYNNNKFNESIKIYQEFLNFQKSVLIDYSNKIKEFSDNIINGDNKENFINQI